MHNTGNKTTCENILQRTNRRTYLSLFTFEVVAMESQLGIATTTNESCIWMIDVWALYWFKRRRELSFLYIYKVTCPDWVTDSSRQSLNCWGVKLEVLAVSRCFLCKTARMGGSSVCRSLRWWALWLQDPHESGYPLCPFLVCLLNPRDIRYIFKITTAALPFLKIKFYTSIR